MLGLLSLNIKGGETVTVTVEGEDQTDAETAINQFFNEQLKEL
jgi:phosphocarrier protein